MIKVINFVNPTSDIIKKINTYHYSSKVKHTYIISEKPQLCADLLLISFSDIEMVNSDKSFCFIPYIVYGNRENLERAFHWGCCDFLKDPWDFAELEMRMLRYVCHDRLFIKGMKVSFNNSYISNEITSLPMTENEYKILSLLVSNADKIISRENIYYRIGIENPESRVIDVYLNSLRNKFKTLCSSEDFKIIQTIRTKGYTINSQFTCG